MIDFLAACIKARINILISGGTGSGKTTLLNALSAFIPDDERVATIEDAAELRLQQPHVVRMETRPANIEGTGEVTTRDLVRNALRMRPDRIIIGECRGPEALDMLQAMNTGHDGSMTTIHANDTRDAISRLEMMVGHGGLRPADLDHPPPDRLGRPDRRPGGPALAAASARSSRSRRSPAWRGTSSACTTSSASSRPAWTTTAWPRATSSASGIRPQCLERLEVSGCRLPPEMFERRDPRRLNPPGGADVTPPLLTVLTFLAAVTAVAGSTRSSPTCSSATATRVSQRVDDEFRRRSATGPGSRSCSRTWVSSRPRSADDRPPPPRSGSRRWSSSRASTSPPSAWPLLSGRGVGLAAGRPGRPARPEPGRRGRRGGGRGRRPPALRPAQAVEAAGSRSSVAAARRLRPDGPGRPRRADHVAGAAGGRRRVPAADRRRVRLLLRAAEPGPRPRGRPPRPGPAHRPAGDQDLRHCALLVQQQTGGNLAELLDKLSASSATGSGSGARSRR